MSKKILLTGSIFCLLAVMIGAFGAHALSEILHANNRASTFETGVKYHFFHGLALLFLGIFSIKKPNKSLGYSAWFFAIGIILFSGSLYLLSVLNIPFFGAITPIGGLCFLTGWLILIRTIWKTTY